MPHRMLREVLLVIVGAKAGNPAETPRLLGREVTAGRLPVDLSVDAPVDLHACLRYGATGRSMLCMTVMSQ